MSEPNVEVLSETVLDGLRLSDWIEQVGISRSAGYELLKVTQIEPEPRKVPGSRKPVSHLTPEQLVILQPLAQQLADGATMPQIKQQLEQSGTGPKQDGSSPRPGFTIHRQEHNGTPFWSVERAVGAVSAHSVPSRQQLGGAVGIGFDVAAAVIDVPSINCAGSDLFDRMRL